MTYTWGRRRPFLSFLLFSATSPSYLRPFIDFDDLGSLEDFNIFFETFL